MKPRATFTPAIAERILTGLSQGYGLRALCRSPDMPTRPTVMRWLNTHPAFAMFAARARELGGLTGNTRTKAVQGNRIAGGGNWFSYTRDELGRLQLLSFVGSSPGS